MTHIHVRCPSFPHLSNTYLGWEEEVVGEEGVGGRRRKGVEEGRRGAKEGKGGKRLPEDYM